MEISRMEILSNLYADLDTMDNYERNWGYLNPVAAAYWRFRDQVAFESIAKWCGDKTISNISVLEIGTGHGHELGKYTQLNIPETQLFGIDLVIDRLKRAKRVYPCIQFTQQDGLLLAFESNSFDVVFQYTCVVHLLTKEEQELICKEMWRVLKPGGVIVWWDVAKPRWRLINMTRILNIIFGKTTIRDAFHVFGQIIVEIFNGHVRDEILKRSIADYLLPINLEDIKNYFSSSRIIQAQLTGLDYKVWKILWARNMSLAEYLWRKGWFSGHIFALLTKEGG